MRDVEGGSPGWRKVSDTKEKERTTLVGSMIMFSFGTGRHSFCKSTL